MEVDQPLQVDNTLKLPNSDHSKNDERMNNWVQDTVNANPKPIKGHKSKGKKKREINPPLPSNPPPRQPLNPDQQFLNEFSEKILSQLAELRNDQDKKIEKLRIEF